MKYKCSNCGSSNIGWDAWADENNQVIASFDYCRCLDCESTDIEKNKSVADSILLDIAKKHLNLETLDVRGLDRLDFSDQSVLSIKKALEEAFDAGYKMCESSRG
jgi:DNA-directed RNA polymerase subunit RPC12/RpoP